MLNNFTALQQLKNVITKEYKGKNLREIQMIIRWQITRDLEARTLKIDQSIFIQDLLKSENMTNCNFINIPIKISYFIKMSKYNDYEESKIKSY